MTSVVEQGVVLAAGRGARLHPLSSVCPKPLAPVCNKPVMQYQLEAMCAAGITEVAVVVAPTGGAIASHFGDGRQLGLRITYLEDPMPAGIAASLSLAERWTRGPFAVFLGDIMFSFDSLAPALEPLANGAAGTLVVRRDSPAAVRRNFAVIADEHGRVSQVIEKPATPPTDLKGCGAYVFDQTIFDAIRRTPRSSLRNEYEITDAVQILIEMGRPVYTAHVARWDVNMTYPMDLLACNLRMLRERKLDQLVGDGVRLGYETRIVTSVIGDHAVIESPVTLQECLVFPSVDLGGINGSMRRHIFAEGLALAADGFG